MVLKSFQKILKEYIKLYYILIYWFIKNVFQFWAIHRNYKFRDI